MRASTATETGGFVRGLNLFDATMLVIGTMIGSGIFLVSADMARLINSPGWLIAAWALTAFLTVAAAISYGELASMMPHAGGVYVFLREAYSPLWGFLYGWTLFAVIQTGTIAAVAVAFARFLSVLVPSIAEDNYIIPPVHITTGYAVSLSTAQLLGMGVIALLTWTNSRGLEYGKIVQNIFTTAKVGALGALIVVGVLLGRNAEASANFTGFFRIGEFSPSLGVAAGSVFGLIVALCVSQAGSLFAADAWHDVTFIAGEVRDPLRNLPRAMAIGCTVVVVLYIFTNIVYLMVLPLEGIQNAPSDRVATAALNRIFPGSGAPLMAIAIMISTFGCINSLVLQGARAYYAMAKDRLFFPRAASLNTAHVPGHSLWMQGAWSAFLVLPRTFNPATGTYGNLYSNLLDYIISAALIFYILTIAAIFRLRWKRPDAERPYRVPFYPVLPALYILGAAVVLVILFAYRPATTWPGLVIVMIGGGIYFALRGRTITGEPPQRS